jgi:hypothetical protein
VPSTVSGAHLATKAEYEVQRAEIGREHRKLESIIKEITLMNAANKPALVSALVVVVVLFLLFGGGAMTGATMGGGMMGNGRMGGISWMWIPTLLTLGLGVLLGWVIFGKKA